LPEAAAVFDFYGAGLSRMRPGGGGPSLALLAAIQGQLTCVSGKADPLIPAEDRDNIGAALINPDRSGQLQRFVACAGADHCFMCEDRGSFDLQSSAWGWLLLLGAGPEV